MHVIGFFYCPYTANKFEIFSRSFARASSLQNFSKQTRKLVAVNELSPEYREINSSRVKVGLQYPLAQIKEKGTSIIALYTDIKLIITDYFFYFLSI